MYISYGGKDIGGERKLAKSKVFCPSNGENSAHAAEAAAAQKKQAKTQGSANEAKKPAQNGTSKGASALSKGKKNRKRRH